MLKKQWINFKIQVFINRFLGHKSLQAFTQLILNP